MNPGKLRHRVYLQTRTRVRGLGGGYTETWADSGPVWANVVPLEGGEAMRGMQLEATVTHRVEMRYRAGVSPTQRIRFGARYFGIQRVIDLEERHVEMHLLCEEVVT